MRASELGLAAYSRKAQRVGRRVAMEVGSMMEHGHHAARVSRAGRPRHPPADSISKSEAKD